MICNKCGAELSDDAAFCNRCGNPVCIGMSLCQKCGAELKEGSIFCEKCGNRVVPYRAADNVKEEQKKEESQGIGFFGCLGSTIGIIAGVIAIIIIITVLTGNDGASVGSDMIAGNVNFRFVDWAQNDFDGKKIIVTRFEVTNLRDTSVLFSPDSSVKVSVRNGPDLDVIKGSEAITGVDELSGELGKNQKAIVEIVFTAPIDWKTIDIHLKPSDWHATADFYFVNQ